MLSLTETQELKEAYSGLQRFSIQEMVDHTKEQRKEIQESMDRTKPFFDHDDTNLLKGLNKEDRFRMFKSLRETSLADIVRRCPRSDFPYLRAKEFLAQSGDEGIAGAAYLVPTKIYQVMFDSAVVADIVADMSIALVPADQIPGATLKVDIAKDEKYKPHDFSSGGKMPEETIPTAQATLDFRPSNNALWGINFEITNDLIEDAQFDVVEMHLRNAGREMGEYATNKACTVLKTGTDGDGTINSGTTNNSDETKYEGGGSHDIISAVKGVCVDGYVPNTMVITHEAMIHSVMSTVGQTSNESTIWDEFAHGTWPTSLAGMNVLYADVDTLTNSKAMTNCVTLVFQKDYALLSGRKRWLRIEKYSDPLRDLAGATVTARQDSVTVYNDSIFKLTEK